MPIGYFQDLEQEQKQIVSKKDQVFAVYEKTLNKIDDVSEYRLTRPLWLVNIMEEMHRDLKKIQNSS